MTEFGTPTSDIQEDRKIVIKRQLSKFKKDDKKSSQKPPKHKVKREETDSESDSYEYTQ